MIVYGRGWGLSETGGLIWDKEYSWQTTSSSSGDFSLNYKMGTSLQTKKDGYLTAQDYVKNGETVVVGLRRATLDTVNEITYNCRLSSECLKERTEGDMVVSWNDCTNPR